MFLIYLNAEDVACIFIIQKIAPEAKSGKYFQIWVFPPKNGGVLSMRMQVILDSSFARPGFSPYMGREERRVQGLDFEGKCSLPNMV